jgi:hypothetical protein
VGVVAGVPAKPEEDPLVPARPRSFWYSLANFLVENNVTPQGVLRATGRFGQYSLTLSLIHMYLCIRMDTRTLSLCVSSVGN